MCKGSIMANPDPTDSMKAFQSPPKVRRHRCRVSMEANILELREGMSLSQQATLARQR